MDIMQGSKLAKNILTVSFIQLLTQFNELKRLRANEGCRSEQSTYFLKTCGLAQRNVPNNRNHISWCFQQLM